MAKLWDRHRFQANEDDYRPVKWPPPGPYWCSGYGNDYSRVVAYLPAGSNELLEYWPEATNDEVQADVEIRFSSRFECPDWWDEAKQGPDLNVVGAYYEVAGSD